jgi:hypothetical protein
VVQRPAQGGVIPGLRLGDPAGGWQADHLEPGVTFPSMTRSASRRKPRRSRRQTLTNLENATGRYETGRSLPLSAKKQQHDVEALRLVPGRKIALGWAPGRAWLLPAQN